MPDKYFLLGKLSPYQGIKKEIISDQNTNDIINEMMKAHRQHKAEYDKISRYFWKGNVKESCKYIFNFLKNNIKYKIEPDTFQSVKSPAAIIATGLIEGHNDCKHYSLFFAGLLDSWVRSGKKINWCYRFANYREGHRIPHHVFVVVNPQTSNEIWCDAVLDYFDQKKQYVNKIDKKMLYSISGVGCCGTVEADNFFGQATLGRRRTRSERKARRKAKRQARRYGENCKGRTGTKIAPPLIAGRRAFLTLVSLNVKQLGKRLVLGLRDPQKRIKIIETWCKLGGNAKTLKATAAKVEKKLIRKGKIQGYVGVAVETIIATAVPILTAISKFLPEGKGKDIIEAATEAGEEYTGNEGTGQDYSDNSTNGVDEPTGDLATVKTLPEVVIKSTRTQKAKFPWIWILAAGAGVYAITKMK